MQDDQTQPQGNWTYHPEGQEPADAGAENTAAAQTAAPQPVSWTASEFIAHHKDGSWYMAVIGVGFVIAAATYFFTRDLISVGAIILVFILFIVISNAKPKQLAYSLDNEGVTIGSKFYPYSLFKSFAIVREGAIDSVSFMPLKRFMPEITIYFAPTDEARILDILTASLPNDQRPERGFDNLMRKIRF